MLVPTPPDVARLAGLEPAEDDPVVRTGAWVRAALAERLLDLPLPGRGRTAERFAVLTALGRVDLDLARLGEAHADAQAILADLGAASDAIESLAPSSTPVGDAGAGQHLWGVWAANPPTDPLRATRVAGGWRLEGVKPWCSGAGTCDRALVTALAEGDGYRLFAVALDPMRGAGDGSASPVPGTWPAPAMRGSDSRSVRFRDHPAVEVGAPAAYLERPGFWHGAVGVAAVWLGGARAVAAPLAARHARGGLHPHALAHAGAIDASLAAAAALLAEAAHAFDADPADEQGRARLLAGRVRAVVERAAADAVERTGRALGAAPLALDARHAQRVADLALYLRQSHAERDLEELGRVALADWPW